MQPVSDAPLIVVNHGIHEIVRVTPEGRVILAPGATLDEASLVFWRAIEHGSPGACQRVLDERSKERKK